MDRERDAFGINSCLTLDIDRGKIDALHPGLEEWLLWDEHDLQLTKLVSEATRLVSAVHRCPLPSQFQFGLKFSSAATEFPEGVRSFPLEGCEVRWNDSLPDEFGVWATFVPRAPNTSRAVICLTHADRDPMLRFIHEIGHLVHTTMLGVLPEERIREFRDVCLADASYKNLRRLATEKLHYLEVAKQATPGDPRLEILNEVALAALVDASADEWFARTYTWLIFRKEKSSERLARESQRMGVDGKTPLYPPLTVADRLASRMGTLLRGF